MRHEVIPLADPLPDDSGDRSTQLLASPTWIRQLGSILRPLPVAKIIIRSCPVQVPLAGGWTGWRRENGCAAPIRRRDAVLARFVYVRRGSESLSVRR